MTELPTNCLKCKFCVTHDDGRLYVSYECGKTGKTLELDNPRHSKPKKCPLKKEGGKQE